MKWSLLLVAVLVSLVFAGCSGEKGQPSPTVSPSTTVTSLTTTTTATAATVTTTATTSTTTTATTTATTTTTATEPTPLELQYGVRYEVKVLRVLDGDTIDVAFPDGQTERVRLLCVDTPEKSAEDNKPYEYDSITDLECLAEWGMKAKEFAEARLGGRYVQIELDPVAGMRGYYGRLLAYVYVDGEDFNAELVKRGYARVYEEGECRKESEYLQYQQRAMQSGTGLWSCKYAVTTTTTESSSSCDPSYPDVCIPPPPPDLDCKDIPYRNFRVLSPDPHRFDADHDGIGCES